MKDKLVSVSISVLLLFMTQILYGCGVDALISSNQNNDTRCFDLKIKASNALRENNFQKAIDTSNHLLSTCKYENGVPTMEIMDAYYFAGIGYYNMAQYQQAADILGQYQRAAGVIEKKMASEGINLEPVIADRIYYYSSMARLHPEKSMEFLNQALQIPGGRKYMVLLDTIYDVGRRDEKLMSGYMEIINDSNNPLREAVYFDRPIKLAESLGDKILAKMLAKRQATITNVEKLAHSRNIGGMEFESGIGASVNQTAYERGVFLSQAYQKAGEPLLASYYETMMKNYQSYINSDADSARNSAEMERSNAEFEAQQRDQTEDLVSTASNVLGAAVVTHVAGGDVAGAVNNSLAESAVSMSDNPALMGQVKDGLQSIANSQRKCSYATPTGFKQCCDSVIKGSLSITQNSDGTITYTCQHPDAYRTAEGCTYSGNKLVNVCAIKG